MMGENERLTFYSFYQLLEEENWPDRVYLHPKDFSILKLKSVQANIKIDQSDGEYITCQRTKVFSGPVKILDISGSRRWGDEM